MSVYRVAVCDDVAIERDILCMQLMERDCNLIIKQFESGEELLRSQESFDIVFMDIYMDGMTGMDTARALHAQNSNIPIVFLTASQYYAVESYEVHAFDYIVKPMQSSRLEQVWERFLVQTRKDP